MPLKTIDCHAMPFSQIKNNFCCFLFWFCRKNNYYYRNLHKKNFHAIFLRWWSISGRVLSLGKQVVVVITAVKWKLCVDFLLNDGVDHMTAFTSKTCKRLSIARLHTILGMNEMSSVQSIYNEATSEWKRYDTTTIGEEKDEEEFKFHSRDFVNSRSVFIYNELMKN